MLFPKEKYSLQKNKINTIWVPSEPSSFSQDTFRDTALFQRVSLLKHESVKKWAFVIPFSQTACTIELPKSVKYEAIVSCTAIVCRWMLRKIRFINCTRFHRLFTIRLKQVCLCILISCLKCSETRAASPSAWPMGRGSCGDVRSRRSKIHIRRCEERWRWHTPVSAINNTCCYLRANSGSRFMNFELAKPMNNDN